MCGIVAVYKKKYINKEQLSASVSAMSHRGPDSENILILDNSKIGFGHARLSIIDKEGGLQPLQNREKNITAVVNGEFYGYKEIRKNLEKKGHVFQTKSDSEIVIFLYKKYGIKFVNYLRGEFALVIYDNEKDIMIAVRDRFGIKPLHYSFKNKNFLVASEAKALLKLGLPAKWDYFSLFHVCTMQYLPTNRSIFENIYQVKPGEMIIFDGKKILKKQYWNLYFEKENEKKKNIDEKKCIDDIHHILIDSIKKRIETDDTPYCCQLSGGIDSALVTAMVSKYGKLPNHCFSISFPYQGYNEFDKAKKIADYIGVPLTKISINQNDIIQNLEKAIILSEGVSINSHIAAKYIMHKKIHEAGYKIVFTGEGADEVFSGYAHLKEDFLGKYKHSTGEKIVGGVHMSHGESLNISMFEKKLGFVPTFIKAKASIGFKNHLFLKDSFKKRFSSQEIMEDILKNNNIETQLKDREKVDISTYLWSKYTLANYILKTLGDGTEMAFSVEGRVPFLDHKLFEKMRNIPVSLKLKNKTAKYILREISKKYLPRDVTTRVKQPFMAPPLSLMSNKKTLRYFKTLFQRKSFEEMNLFDDKKLIGLIDNIQEMSIEDQIAYEPTIMLFASISILNDHYKLSL